LTESPTIQDAQRALQKYWNFQDFRTKQKEVVSAVLAGDNVIALLATGGGKSLCYQIPALLYSGITIVVSPLISLMEDQVMALKKKGIKAEALHSGHTYNSIDRIMDNCIYGDIKLLYVSPERLLHDVFKVRVQQMDISLIAIDEAHCISQWGHDFRPSYLKISELLESLPKTQVLALTATATKDVLAEIQQEVLTKESKIIQDSFSRENLAITVKSSEDKLQDIIDLTPTEGKSIVYARSRRNVQMIAETLANHKVKSRYYHAGLSYKEKKKIQEDFAAGKIQSVVATNAFGMGIDVADIRHVIHYDIPPSLEEYYQEIGRAGRDGKSSQATLLISKNNINYAKRRVTEAYPDFDLAAKMYKSLHVYYDISLHEGIGIVKPLDLKAVAKSIGSNQREVHQAISLWQKLGVLESSQELSPRTYIKVNYSPVELRKESKRNPKLYEVLDYLMRHYEYLFTGWIRLDIDQDLRKLKTPKATYEEQLQELVSQDVIRLYRIPAGQMVGFIENRISTKHLDHYIPKYQKLKQLALHRWESIERYVNSEVCRMKVILSYFGEESDPCGSCDVCTGTMKEISSVSISTQSDLETR